MDMVLYMLALAGQPSLQGYDACMIFWAKGGHSGEIAGKFFVRLLFSRFFFWFFCELFFLVGRYACLASMDWQSPSSWYGYQGADREAEKLALTDQLLDAALGEIRVVSREQPCLVVGDFNVEPTKIPCLWVDFEAAWAVASGRQPRVSSKRSWDSAGGSRRDFMVSCPRAAAAVSQCVVQEDRWILPHLAFRTHFEYSRWVSRVSQPFQRTPLWPASWLPVLDKESWVQVRGSAEGLGVFMMIGCSL